MSKKILVVYSGGMDSRTVLQEAIHTGGEVVAINMDYGQKHYKEAIFANKVCADLAVPILNVNLSFMKELSSASSLFAESGRDIPEGHYEAENMKDTVIPNRNMLLLSVALAYAETIGAESVWYGAHSGDHHIYPDCRPEFVEAINATALLASEKGISIYAPFLKGNKETILRRGMELGVDYIDSWTCYNGRDKACGKCGSCQERLEAFAALDLVDPLEYEA